MALDVCNICSNTPEANCLRAIIGHKNSDIMWRKAIIELLCGISGAVGGGSNIVSLTQLQFSAATLQAGYTNFADTGFLNSTKKLNHVWITNNTDADMEFSLDGGATVSFTVLANTSRELELGNYTGAAVDSFQMRRASGMNATIGTLYLEGTYNA